MEKNEEPYFDPFVMWIILVLGILGITVGLAIGLAHMIIYLER